MNRIHQKRRALAAQARTHGVPVSDLRPVDTDGTTGTCVRFRPDPALRAHRFPTAGDAVRRSAHWPGLTVRLDHPA
ncbi:MULTISPECIES: hypothetical protein [Streptomyces]|uniref:hypothetical protein n=1 Tax=Streptomyces TaxID=1883 RepID=UPI001602D7C8|nr:hypothetical protein [Streptomyces sp. gCLA4]MBZ9593600.1 hypothetical protein [Streptomyces erythrochromogenes]